MSFVRWWEEGRTDQHVGVAREWNPAGGIYHQSGYCRWFAPQMPRSVPMRLASPTISEWPTTTSSMRALDCDYRHESRQANKVLRIARIERELVGVGGGRNEQVRDPRPVRAAGGCNGCGQLSEAARTGRIKLQRIEQRFDLLQAALSPSSLKWILREMGAGRQFRERYR
jgi:hypothetical protein